MHHCKHKASAMVHFFFKFKLWPTEWEKCALNSFADVNPWNPYSSSHEVASLLNLTLGKRLAAETLVARQKELEWTRCYHCERLASETPVARQKGLAWKIGSWNTGCQTKGVRVNQVLPAWKIGSWNTGCQTKGVRVNQVLPVWKIGSWNLAQLPDERGTFWLLHPEF